MCAGPPDCASVCAQLLPHAVCADAGAQLPAPSQPAVQLAADGAQRVSTPTGLHVPCPLTLQRLQAEHEDVLQQTPSTQLPLPQSVPTVQAVPLGVATQAPPMQILAVPHGVLSATFPVTPHTDEPVAHDVRPVWQTLPPGVQAWLGVQLLHAPPEQ
jgi:hypothetical protein